MEPEGSLTHSQEPTTCPQTDLHESNSSFVLILTISILPGIHISTFFPKNSRQDSYP
jgi:hypothetical protein